MTFQIVKMNIIYSAWPNKGDDYFCSQISSGAGNISLLISLRDFCKNLSCVGRPTHEQHEHFPEKKENVWSSDQR